ncbi:MAG: 2-oxoacid:acceptor oxidoreductase family protein [Thermoanaerobaculum sp.]|nr:2-oxoacid:acceptor oxidoreductase family protein [Thermoanaerobaculum sp.]MDW7966523.1 2-oxoacid:acceptor oxidoreductase family protein [Thermoanaerobaculum sp.]
MRELRIHGRGGQGAVIASEILAEAAFLAGHYVQAFPSFGSERRGAPVAAFVRLDNQPILVRNEVYQPDGVVVLDESLVTLGLANVTQGLKEGGFVLLNSAKDPEEFAFLGPYTVATVDASRIAVEHRLGSLTAPIVNTAILGALAALSGWVSLAHLEEAIRSHVPVKPEENVAAARRAFEAVKIAQPTLVGR